MTPFTLIDLARQAGSVEELVSLAQQNKFMLSEEDAQIYFERWHDSGELSDEELDAVGGGYEERAEKVVCEFCGSDNLSVNLSGSGFYCNGCRKPCRGERI